MANEKRLIDANLVKRAVKEVMADCSSEELFIKVAEQICKMLDHAPTVDSVEVVRCENCRYFGTSQCAMDTYAFDVTEESFCSYGERRSDV